MSAIRVELFYITAGGGHIASAAAVAASVREQHPDWVVARHDLFHVLDPDSQFRRVTGLGPADFYNKRLAKGWTLGMSQELKLLQFSIALLHDRFSAQLQAHWQASRPDLVVSLVPNFNRAMHAGLQLARPGVPFVTLLTDLADNPPNFWIEANQQQDFICGTVRAVEQALRAGHPADRVHPTSGMVIHPKFHRAALLDRSSERLRNGLDPRLPTGVVTFGGTGSSRMREVARRLDDTQLILLCGRNRELAERLRRTPAAAPRLVVEFTDDIAYYMSLADFFIGKPGPGSLSEAVALHLPVIVESNRWTMPQEAYNVSWVEEHGLGVVIHSAAQVAGAVDHLLRDAGRLRANLERMRNRAVFEVPGILHAIHMRARRGDLPASEAPLPDPAAAVLARSA